MNDEDDFPPAKKKRHYFESVWILPIIAALITGYLAIRSYVEHGSDITISFKSADGFSVGQTQLKYKAVTLGTVTGVDLKPDHSGVIVSVTTTNSARKLLTDHARFWVMRPHLNASDISNLQVLVAGTYIQLSPGAPGGEPRTSFVGLEQPPPMYTDEPGRVYLLKTDQLGSLSAGSPVYFRDINVGQVLSYDIGDGFGPITLSIVVRDPYAQFVHEGSRFWNASGLNISLTGGLHLEFQSIQSVLAGGISFMTPMDAKDQPQADAKTTFTLFDGYKAALLAGDLHVLCVSYYETPVKDLGVGSPVNIYGMRVGSVEDVKLVFDPAQNKSRVRVAYTIKPDLAFGSSVTTPDDAKRVMHDLVQKGLHATLESSDLLIGHDVIALEYAPEKEPAPVEMEEDALLIPGSGGGMGNIANALGTVAGKLNQIPFDEIGNHLNHLLASADNNFGGPEMKKAVHDLAETLANAQKVSESANQNLTPALQKLPDISNQLQNAVAQANAFMSSVNTGYGEDSDFHRNVKRVVDEVNDAARSIRLLADYLDRHPEALLAGKSGASETLEKDKK